ncbi:MAG: hypothetical protein KQH79_05385 [Bacteroidetes bacterium]|nr:hypothetical protein [Bacteroidota bacterium]
MIDIIGILEFRVAYLNNLQANFDFGSGLSSKLRFILKLIILLIALRYMLYQYVSYFTFLIYMFIFYWLLTGISYFFNDKPLSLFLGGINAMIIPSLFYFIGNYRRNISDKFYRRTLFILCISFCVGLVYHFASVDWYIEWKIRKFMAIRSDFTWGEARGTVGKITSGFAAFSGGYFVGYMSFIGLSIAYYFYNKKYNLINLLYVVVFVVILLLSQRRVAIVAGAGVIFIYHIYGLIKGKKQLNNLLFAYVILFCFFVLVFHNIFFELFEKIVLRLANIANGDIFAERSYSWFDLLRSQTNFLFGHGLQSGGAAAVNRGYLGINDGEFFKFIYEGGIIGLLIFLMLNILTICRGLKRIKIYAIELSIIVFFLIATLGANPFSNMPNIIIIYWFAMGRIWNKGIINKNYRIESKRNNLDYCSC